MTWMPTVSGRAVDLVSPLPDQVDFGEIAWSLAHENRYAGAGQTPVSVAHHTLIGFDLCPERLRPLWLIHDAHKARTGDTPRPVRDALAEAADAELGDGSGAIVRKALALFVQRHDAVIHAAAGLALPTEGQREEIAALDQRCLAIEHGTFHRPSERPWCFQRAGLPIGHTTRRFQAPDKMADQLARRFADYLPALRAEA